MAEEVEEAPCRKDGELIYQNISLNGEILLDKPLAVWQHGCDIMLYIYQARQYYHWIV